MDQNEMNTNEANATAPNLTDAAPQALCDRIVEILDAKKAQDLKVLKVTEQTVIADYFVICTGTSNTQVRALAGEVEFKLGQSGVKPLRDEGEREGTWIILDYGCVLVHIFGKQTRDFYNLEKLWGDAEHLDISALIKDDSVPSDERNHLQETGKTIDSKVTEK